ncbi:Glucose--fructose oxidoreductase precursor [Poriferisphaera corsica]|uniref:Glucose--fructose oxidoreductase n=1 Tax=Poriferisphaera corsica TaxID=2528020 RepID=A0A517YW59_9BACT|nr:Gfo/Idh/MocA family oxidoreductase [Poriferisphaera corsica]QDU34447.1 Glucose--fructose oxidoreductase precursor [Poriferisphaera corsica]
MPKQQTSSTDANINKQQSSTLPEGLPAGIARLPDIDLRQLYQLTDDTGIFQHAVYAAPDPNHGYCIDDNARALIAAVLHARLRGYDERIVPLQRYLTFLAYAYNEDTHAFRNFMGYDRHWLEDIGSTDSQGRTIWALGLTVHHAPNDIIRELAEQLLFKSYQAASHFKFIRSQTFSLIGLQEYLSYNPDHKEIRELRDVIANRLFDRYKENATQDWPWWENTVTYDNAKLPHALLICGKDMRRDDMVEAALTSLEWLYEVQLADDGHLSIIGNDGWLQKGHTKAMFDQQPLEAYAMIHGCLTAAAMTKDSKWAKYAWNCFSWFTGRNDTGIPLYHPDTGGCQDGLEASGPNKNQGAESSLAYLLSVLELHLYYELLAARITSTQPETFGIGLIGDGNTAAFTMQNFVKHEHLRPISAWSTAPEKVKHITSPLSMTACNDLKDLLDDPRIQIIYIASQPNMRSSHAIAALNAGKHVLLEKPIATDLGSAHQIIQTAHQRDLVLGVNLMMRFGPLTHPVKQLIRRSILGMPLRGYYINRAGDAGLPDNHWFWDNEISGGIFIEHGVHAFDLMRYWLGESQVLSASRFRRHFNDDPNEQSLIDQATCDLRYGYQTTVNFYHGFNQPVPLDMQDSRIIFERGQIILRGWIPSQIEIRGILTNSEIDQLQALFPKATIKTIRTFDEPLDIMHHHGRSTRIDCEIHLKWSSDHDKQTLYSNATQHLMQDFIKRIEHRRHRLRADANDALAALMIALDADRIAKGVTP